MLSVEDYVLGAELGRGTYGRVCLGRRKPGKPLRLPPIIAVKCNNFVIALVCIIMGEGGRLLVVTNQSGHFFACVGQTSVLVDWRVCSSFTR